MTFIIIIIIIISIYFTIISYLL